MKYVLLIYNIWLTCSVFGQYTGTGAVTQGRAVKIVTGLYSCAGGRPTDQGVISSSNGAEWVVPAEVHFKDAFFPYASDLYNSCNGALYSNATTALSKLDGEDIIEIDTGGQVITAFIFADNYFEMYINGIPAGKDKVPFTPFNASIVRFKVKIPFTVAMLLVDWEENLGLGSEINGGFAFHPGDGGVVAVFKDEAGAIIDITNKSWKAQTFYTSPIMDLNCPEEEYNERLSTACSTQDSQNGANYYALHWNKPAAWFTKDFDDRDWPYAYEFSDETVGINNKPAYTNFKDIFDNNAKDARFIWSSNIILDNEVIIRKVIGETSAAQQQMTIGRPFIYPNPGHETLCIQIQERNDLSMLWKIDVVKPDGSLLINLDTVSQSVDIAGYPSGIYLVKFYFSQQIICLPWIKL